MHKQVELEHGSRCEMVLPLSDYAIHYLWLSQGHQWANMK